MKCDIIGINNDMQLYFLAGMNNDLINLLYKTFNDTKIMRSLFADYFHWLISESPFKNKKYIISSYITFIKNKFSYHVNAYTNNLGQYNSIDSMLDMARKIRFYKLTDQSKKCIYLCRDIVDFMFKHTNDTKIRRLQTDISKIIKQHNLDNKIL